jgi:hypothetical protein
MPRVICWQRDCLYNVHGRCRAEEIEYDPDDGCLTQEPPLDTQEIDNVDEDDWELTGRLLQGDEG